MHREHAGALGDVVSEARKDAQQTRIDPRESAADGSDRYVDCFDALAAAYLQRVDWESVAGLEQRAAQLLPGLLLGRIDGKSPVEYIVDEDDRRMVRDVALALLRAPPDALGSVRDAWIRGTA